MRLTEYLTEASGQYGIVISKQKDGKFEDIELYDIAANNIARQEGHIGNLFSHLVETIREHDAWHEIEQFIQSKAKSSKVLGPDYADDENFVNTLYGPFGMDQIGHLADEFGEQYRNDEPPFRDQEDW